VRILLLSAYDANSHRLWRERLAALLPEHDWCQLALPARHFDWRIRSNSLHWGLSEDEALARPADLLIATSMVDLAALRGLRPQLAQLPTLLYFHENQLFYPANKSGDGPGRRDNIEPLLIPIYSALCADAIVFNSDFNRQSFLKGARELFARLPDDLPASAWQKLETARVIAVPVAAKAEPAAPRPARPHLELLWNHRWEYDKGPELLLTVCEQLAASDLPVRLHICGQQFRQQPSEFSRIDVLCQQMARAQNLDRGCFGFLPTEQYQTLLQQCDVVLSTAWQEFQGLGIQEACLAGCAALVPDDLAYREYLPPDCRYGRSQDLQASARAVVERLAQWLQAGHKALPRVSMDQYCGPTIAAKYRQCFEELLQAKP
jgi:glycosyltransferase involved in cell wall biosynthesis